MQIHENFETFSDPAYRDMWCLRRKGSTNFNETIHFLHEHGAIHASHVVAKWIKEGGK